MWVSPWFFVKKSTFFSKIFFEQKARKKCFQIFWIEKNAFQTTKVKFYKTLKNRHFAKGLVHAFCQKIDLFLMFFFSRKKSQNEAFFDILNSKEYFLDLKSEVLAKLKISTFCKGLVHGFCLKMDLVVLFFFYQEKPERNIV